MDQIPQWPINLVAEFAILGNLHLKSSWALPNTFPYKTVHCLLLDIIVRGTIIEEYGQGSRPTKIPEVVNFIILAGIDRAI